MASENKNGLIPGNFPKSYWLEVPPLTGSTDAPPKRTGIVVVGSGLAGASAAYWLQKAGFDDVTVVDYLTEQAATFRNAGHILYGTVESMKAMVELHGEAKAKELWQFSIDICNQVETTINELDIAADYKRDGYLVISIDETEDKECRDSVTFLNKMGYQSDYVSAEDVYKMGFRNCYGARFEKGSARAHPTKFRNGVLRTFLERGGKYHSGVQVTAVDEHGDGVTVKTSKGTIECDAVVLCTNAYTPLFSSFFEGLVDPYRGQIIASKPLKHRFPVKHAHSFDHGYQYAVVTEDNRLVLGGWRNHSSTREMGIYSIDINTHIEQGLKQFAQDYYGIGEKIEWSHSWAGIMALSKTSLPFIGNTSSPRIYSCLAFTGHGFSWAHGSAKLLADIMAGNPLPEVARHFNPKLAK
ncbi:MAG TPA: FAD-dependent oxidoreductase [Bdellovibrionota bacterium]|nr:FAD-dependent oxidoreductase [Bdellovibrionota bacterium]